MVNVPGDDNDTAVKEGGSTGDIITVFIDPSEPLTVVFPEGGGIRELPIVVSTNDYLAIELQSFQAQKTLTVTGAVKDGRTSSSLSGASVVVAWGDGSSCTQTVSGGASGTFTANHTYGSSETFTVDIFAFKDGYASVIDSFWVISTATAIQLPIRTIFTRIHPVASCRWVVPRLTRVSVSH